MTPKLPTRPRIRETFVRQTIGDDTLLLLSEQRFVSFENNRVIVALAPHLDGTKTVPELLARASALAPVPMFFAALGQMAHQGVLADGPARTESAAFFDNFDAPLVELAVSITAFGDASRLSDSLVKSGVKIDPDAELAVVVAGDYLQPELEAWNASRVEQQKPWLLTKPSGAVIWVGPLFRPGKTACWKCLQQRLRANREVERFVEKYGKEQLPDRYAPAALPSMAHSGASFAALEVIKALAYGDKEPPGPQAKINTFDLLSGESTVHAVVRRPQCSVCGEIKVLDQKPIELRSQPKANAAFSDHRSMLPEETFAKYAHHISPISGVVTSLVPRDDETGGLVNNHTAGHYFPFFTDSVEQMQINRWARSGAGGRTPAHAKTSALCESLERYSAIFWGEEQRIKASYASLGEQAVHIRELSQYSETQYAKRGEFNARALRNQQLVSDPLDDHTEIYWTPAWSLTHGRFRYVPTSYLFYGYRDPDATRLSDSNGNAAGNTLEEAIIHGFFELIERDAVAMWWYNRVRRPELDAESFGLRYWNDTKRVFDRLMQREMHALDLTADSGIPTVAVVSRRKDWPIEDITTGFAAHLDPAVALSRALAGANQYLASLTRRQKDGNTLYRFIDPETLAWWKSATYAKEPYLLPDPSAKKRGLHDFPKLATSDVKTDLELCIEITKKLGLEMLVVDMTRPDVGLPVAKVLVPGLRHFWRRLSPGRLYDVPVQLGWLERAHTEDEMNPIACFV